MSNKKKARRPARRPGSFARYEALKAKLTESASTPAQYMAACRRAARLAGV